MAWTWADFGRRVREVRERFGLTEEDLAVRQPLAFGLPAEYFIKAEPSCDVCDFVIRRGAGLNPVVT